MGRLARRRIGRMWTVEPLEARALLSGVSFDGQFLFVDGTGKGDRVLLSTDPGGLSVRITFNGQTTLFPARSISSVFNSTGGGDDKVLADADFPVELDIESGT